MDNITPSFALNKDDAILTAYCEMHQFSCLESKQEMDIAYSPAANTCSFPKIIGSDKENPVAENSVDDNYAARCNQCKDDLAHMTGKALRMTYSTEYKAWSNSKHRSKTLKDITGPCWGPELDSFPGFLKITGPKLTSSDSLDRIEPSYGYVAGNMRWASKQLQSDNRRNVETYLVHGEPMTLRLIARRIGITSDALRMRLARGQSMDEILGINTKPSRDIRPGKNWPWPKGREQAWENNYQLKRRELSPENPDSRVAFMLAVCRRNLFALREEGRALAEKHGDDAMMPKGWVGEHEYWQVIYARALELDQLEKEAKQAKTVADFYLGPTQEELADIADSLVLQN